MFRRLHESEDSGLAYVTHDDIKALPEFAGQTILAIKAPQGNSPSKTIACTLCLLLGTILEILDPDEGMSPPNRRYELFLRSSSGAIDVSLVSAGDQSYASNCSKPISSTAIPNVATSAIRSSIISMDPSPLTPSSNQPFSSPSFTHHHPNSAGASVLPSSLSTSSFSVSPPLLSHSSPMLSLLSDCRLAGSPSLGSIQSIFSAAPFSLSSSTASSDASELRAAALTRTASLLGVSPKFPASAKSPSVAALKMDMPSHSSSD